MINIVHSDYMWLHLMEHRSRFTREVEEEAEKRRTAGRGNNANVTDEE